MERRRVVITGLGAITPVGLTAVESWQAVKDGACGIAPITQFDPSDMKVKLAAEVKGFVPEDHLGKPEAKRMGRFTQFAVVSAREAMADAGFVMGEGAGVLVLEELEHAKQRGATIYAELTGYGSTCDAYHITSPDPSAAESARAIADAWRETGLDTDRVYFNAHGTGTPMNDRIETLAIKKALGEDRARRITISSTKSMTGHMLGAAGGAEAVASVLALRDGIAPPTINLTQPDPDCDLDYTPLTAKHADFDVALSSSLGFGGHNACLAFRKWED